MSYSGDAAEQVVRLSLETGEVAVKLAGEGAKQLAILYYREHGTAQGCPGVSTDAAEIIDKGIEAGEFPDGQPFSIHDVLHEYYEAQRLRREIEALESLELKPKKHDDRER
ncbi:hypothetical protein D5272_16860 [bacterium D16-76]|nr:hypothetical protein [bacterium D16-76]